MVIVKSVPPSNTASEDVVTARTFTGKMRNNPNFANPIPSLQDVDSDADTLELAAENARLGGLERTQAVKDAQKVLRNHLRQLGLYVSVVANGDVQKILSAGMEPVRPHTHGKRDYKALPGDRPGTAKLVSPYLPGSSKVWEVCKDEVPTATSVWSIVAETTLGSISVNSFRSGEIVWFRMHTISNKGASVYSDPIRVVIP